MKNFHHTLVALLLTACARSADAPAPDLEGDLEVVRAVTILESDSVFIARPSAIETTPDGAFLVGDLSSASVLEFDATGGFVRRYGNRRGKGPGEMVAPVAIAVGPDGGVAVEDAALRRTSEFERGTGTLLRSVVHAGDLFSLAYHGVRLRGALFDVADTAAILDFGASPPTVLGALPQSLRSPAARTYLRHAVLSNDSTSTVTAYPGLDSLYVHDHTDRSVRTIPVPVRRRAGSSAALLKYAQGGVGRSFDPDTVRVSWPVRVRRRTDGVILLLFLDPATSRLPARYHVTALVPSGLPAFTDLRVPLASPDRTVASLTDSSVLLLEQLVDDRDIPTTRIREFRLPGTGSAQAIR